MINKWTRNAAAIAVALTLASGCGDDGGGESAAASPFAGVPDIDATGSAGVRRQFVGVDSSGEFSIAVVETESGALVAYVCNGIDSGVWMTADSLAASGTAEGPGGSLSYRIEGEELSGTATLGATELTFALAAAGTEEGLYRSTVGEEVTGWIFTDGGASVRGSTASGTGVTSTGLVGDFLARRKCSKIIVRYSQGKMQTLQTGNDDLENQAQADFAAANCQDHGFAL